ncbi:MAG: glutamine--fructose-6-phosphate transaminase (isomerizing) [Deltaproteobacteria bacterium]|nr:glutamine--fructose-6-phosphate transaminase (isomerizing) [Deltaproteobacteria bacterium]
MCGIVGYIGPKQAEPVLLEGLARLEYRGYDSAGIATLIDGGTQVRRAAGKLVNLANELKTAPCEGNVGIGHTRWATHGAPTEQNAHPHTADGITVVHNGIIENHLELRRELVEKGRVFSSDTDTEIFAHLIALEQKNGASLLKSMQHALQKAEGAFALAVIDEEDPSQIAFARLASPLVVGLLEGENFLASDIPAVLSHTRTFIFLEDGDVGILRKDGVEIYNSQERAQKNDDTIGELVRVERDAKTVDWSPVMAEKDGHKHFMHKEIFEQPRAITDTLRGRLSFDEGKVLLDDVDTSCFTDIHRMTIIACGTSWHAGLTGRYLIEKLARLPVDVDLASEFRYRDPVVDEHTLVLAISQSGETADTLAALKEAQRRGAKTMSICNVIESAIPRLVAESVGTLYTRAGPEIGVASTKAFTTQLVALHLIALSLAQHRGTASIDVMQDEMRELAKLPLEVESLLEDEKGIEALAKQFVHSRDMLYLGRGPLFPIALEGALKLKEISYIHAEGYAAGEMKHGPIALIDEEMPVVVLAVRGPGYEKVVANLEEVRARGGKVISVVTHDDHGLDALSVGQMRIPEVAPHLVPVLATVPLQLFSYHVADLRGTDVDQPRNLAKSVTVE